jgi:hypothetical protein
VTALGARAAGAALFLGLSIFALAIWSRHAARERVEGDLRFTDSTAERSPAPAVPWLAPGRVAEGDPIAEPAVAGMGDGIPLTDDGWRELSLEVTTVAADTGAPLSGRWSMHATARDRFSEFESREDRLRRWDASFLASGESESWMVWGDYDQVRSVHVLPPPRYVALGDSSRLDAVIAADARALVALVPLHRETVLAVHATGPDGRPAAGAKVAALDVAGQDVFPVVADTGPGAMRIRGIPHLPGEPVRIALEWTSENRVEAETPELTEGIASPQIVATVPTDSAATWNVAVELPGPVGYLHDRVETDQDVPEPALPGLRWAPSGTPLGRVRVKALDVDERPLRRGLIAEESLGLGRQAVAVDERGEILLGFPAGEATVRVASIGRFDAVGHVAVVADATTDLVVREPRGARLDVLVVDEEGRPRPFARLDLGRAWFDVEGDRQRIDAFTDANGRRTISRVEPGTATVKATWGSRRGEASVVLRDAERASVRIVAR